MSSHRPVYGQDEFFRAHEVNIGEDLPAASSDGRLCVAFKHTKLHSVFIIDLDLQRLSETARKHPFGNVGSRLLMQTAASEVSDIQLDACGAFLLSSKGLLGFDHHSLLDVEASQGTTLVDNGAQRVRGGATDASEGTTLVDDGAQRVRGGAADASYGDVSDSSFWTDSEAEDSESEDF
ncbi:hypothetical protein IE81DRAFT_15195 [Ceraceosorus guamensis]|uniref:Uncharacterized protein n=1 Tax=Ceraceosorus guamensis TaxID=1522189 RepID=A0A316VTT1_9BASI|nr:hypothetical protein IE81DRAFT_15195 [Ceraceosorus guamensis]PWN39631.1 hypothetical protein IE81DRAFT_15195 [Ceraceosorus guamensis]